MASSSQVKLILEGVAFTWDDAKAASNLRKHGVTFEEAASAASDPLAALIGSETVDGEARDTIVGWSSVPRLLLVVHTERGDQTRIISARTATGAERRRHREWSRR